MENSKNHPEPDVTQGAQIPMLAICLKDLNKEISTMHDCLDKLNRSVDYLHYIEIPTTFGVRKPTMNDYCDPPNYVTELKAAISQLESQNKLFYVLLDNLDRIV